MCRPSTNARVHLWELDREEDERPPIGRCKPPMQSFPPQRCSSYVGGEDVPVSDLVSVSGSASSILAASGWRRNGG